jgi:hypothetical protein
MTIPAYQSFNGTPLNPAPPNLPVVAPQTYSAQFENQILNVLRLYFVQLNNYTQATATPDYGTTVNRPPAPRQIGQIYFDITLNIPIWWNGKNWVNASGTSV